MPNDMKNQPVDPVVPQGKDPNDPKVQELMKKAKGYENVLKRLIHGEETRDEVINMLKAGNDPFVSVPQAAVTINDMGLDTMKRGGVKVEAPVQIAASVYLVDDLMKLGEAAQAFTTKEGDKEAILEDTYQMAIEKGLKDGSIDPIQLQLEVEPLMTEDQLVAGVALGGGQVPQKPPQEAMNEQYANKKVKARESAIQQKFANKETQQKRQALTGMIAKGGPQNG